jgi:hypothetical protein
MSEECDTGEGHNSEQIGFWRDWLGNRFAWLAMKVVTKEVVQG